MLLFLLALVCPCSIIGQTAQGPAAQQIGDGVYSFSSSGRVYFSMFVVTSEGVVVIDPMNTEHSTEMLAAIREVTELPVTHVMYSHNHWDHTGGAGVLGARNVVARADAAAWIEANPKPDGSVVVPNIVWKGTEKRMEIGGVVFDMKYIGLNHGTGNTIFLLPQQKLAFIADLVWAGSLDFPAFPDGSPVDQDISLRKILDMDFTRAVFSHNMLPNALEGGTKEDVQNALNFHVDLRAEVRRLLGEGAPFFSIPDLVKLPKYESLPTYDIFIKPNTWTMISEQIVGPYGHSGISESRLLSLLLPGAQSDQASPNSAPLRTGVQLSSDQIKSKLDCSSDKWPAVCIG